MPIARSPCAATRVHRDHSCGVLCPRRLSWPALGEDIHAEVKICAEKHTPNCTKAPNCVRTDLSADRHPHTKPRSGHQSTPTSSVSFWNGVRTHVIRKTETPPFSTCFGAASLRLYAGGNLGLPLSRCMSTTALSTERGAPRRRLNGRRNIIEADDGEVLGNAELIVDRDSPLAIGIASPRAEPGQPVLARDKISACQRLRYGQGILVAAVCPSRPPNIQMYSSPFA